MNTKSKVIGAVAAVVVAAGIGVPLAVLPGSTPKPLTLMAPTPDAFPSFLGGTEPNGSPLPPDSGGPDMNCGPDMTSVLQTFLAGIPNGSTIVFPHDACYTVDNGLVWQMASNDILNANGAIFNQWPAAPASPDTEVPVLFLHGDTNVTITGLNIQGAWDGSSSNHGEAYEGKIGILEQGDTNVTVTDTTIQGTQGDVFALNQPSSLPGNPLNVNSVVSNSTFNQIGYTLSVEAANGAHFVHDYINQAEEIDFEVDDESSGFSGGPFSDDTSPSFVAQDNVSFSNDFISELGHGWTSLQGGSAANFSSPFPAQVASGSTLTLGFTSNVTATDGSTTLSIGDASACFVGEAVYGTGIPTFATVTAVNTTSTPNVVTISGATPGGLVTGSYIFGTNLHLAVGRLNAGVTTGQVVYGSGITSPTYATISGVNYTQSTITLSGVSPGPLATGTYNIARATCFEVALCQPAGCVGTACTGYNGVQQYNVTFSGDTLACGSSVSKCATFQATGQDGSVMPNKYLNIGLTITHDTLVGTAGPQNGSSCTPNGSSAMVFNYVSNITITDNVIPGYTGTLCSNKVNIAAVEAQNPTGTLTVEGNSFPGMSSVINPNFSTVGATVTECGNTYGLNGSLNDGSCP